MYTGPKSYQEGKLFIGETPPFGCVIGMAKIVNAVQIALSDTKIPHNDLQNLSSAQVASLEKLLCRGALGVKYKGIGSVYFTKNAGIEIVNPRFSPKDDQAELILHANTVQEIFRHPSLGKGWYMDYRVQREADERYLLFGKGGVTLRDNRIVNFMDHETATFGGAIDLDESPNRELKIEAITGLRMEEEDLTGRSVHISERAITAFPYFQDFASQYLSEFSEDQKKEVEKTLSFLFSKFQILFENPKFQEFGISDKEFIFRIGERLRDLILEAENSGRVFKNGTVGALRSISENGDFILEPTPFFAQVSTNGSLDDIAFDTHSGKKSLRQIMEAVGDKNEAGEYYLQASLGVSVLIQLVDGTLVGQYRNNQKTAVQFSGLTASASGTMKLPKDSTGQEGLDIIVQNALKETYEELGVTGGQLSLGSLVWEENRRKFEAVCLLKLPHMTLADIEQKRQAASHAWESRGLVHIYPSQVDTQIGYLARALSPVFPNASGYANILEDYIRKVGGKMPDGTPLVGEHLLMSVLGLRSSGNI